MGATYIYIVGLNMWSVSISYGVDRSDELNNVRADVSLMVNWEWKCLSYWTWGQMVANCVISELRCTINGLKEKGMKLFIQTEYGQFEEIF